MNLKTGKVKALGLCSGGLDSMLSARVLQEQGIEVAWINFETPFFSADKARIAAQMTGIPLTVRRITDIYVNMLKNPNCGYGRNMNPCLDCHALMFRLAGETMREQGIDFLFSGEVLGQRPMSQTKPSLRYVEKNSGCEGYILRPLSAGLLPETIPEKTGLVDRRQLLSLSGRSRKPQLELAAKYGIRKFPAPAGGCLLTEPVFSRRLKDLSAHQTPWSETNLNLLRFGRHLRLDEATRLIIGRTFEENENLLRHRDPNQDTIIKLNGFPGPTALMPGGGNPELISKAAGICIAYSKAPQDRPLEVMVTSPSDKTLLHATAADKQEIEKWMI